MSEQTILNTSPQPDEDDTLSLVDLLVALGEEKKTFFGVTLGGTLLALATAFLVPRYYEASTVVLPPQQSQSAAAGALSQLGALAGVAGVSSMKQNDELYAALMRSRTLQDAIIQRFDLQKVYEIDSMEATRKTLANNVVVALDKKSGLITVTATDRVAERAAHLANAYPAELGKRLDVLAVTEAQQRRKFFESEVGKTQTKLAEAEVRFRELQGSSGLLPTEVLAESSIRVGAEIRGSIAAKEVQLNAVQRFSTPQNPDVQRLASELSALRGQLTQLEEGGKPKAASERGMQAVKAYRDVKIQTAALDALSRQLELAKVDESKEGPLLQAVDPASPPERASKPKRLMVLVGGALMSMVLALVVVFFRRTILMQDDDLHSQGKRLAQAWRR